MSNYVELYGAPSRAFVEAMPLMQAITTFTSGAYVSPTLPPATRKALLSLPVRNALSMIERACMARMAADEEPTLLLRLNEALLMLDKADSDDESCVIRASLRDLQHFLISYLQLLEN